MIVICECVNNLIESEFVIPLWISTELIRIYRINQLIPVTFLGCKRPELISCSSFNMGGENNQPDYPMGLAFKTLSVTNTSIVMANILMHPTILSNTLHRQVAIDLLESLGQ
jgi:hypothetical protein